MLTREENERLTATGRGTPGGELLRRYWWPVAARSEIDDNPTKAVRLLGEDLVLFRDRRGTLGLIAEHCPHRGASLAYGFPEETGLRCPYHGWCFDEDGTCLEQPNEMRYSPRFRERGATTAYPVEELGGLVFAYLGPAPRPLLPRYDVFAAEHGPRTLVDIGATVVPCNWLQIMENSLDPTHSEWLHGRFFDRILESRGQERTTLAGHHVKLAFERFDYGLIKRRLRAGQSEEEDDWRLGHPVIFPHTLCVGNQGLQQFQIRVPIDDQATRHLWYSRYELSDEAAELLGEVGPTGRVFEFPIHDEAGRFIVDHIDGQDIMVWATQGQIADRTVEHIGASDRGIVMFRQLLKEQIEAVQAGSDPLGVLRDPAANELIEFWVESKALGAGASAGNEMAGYLRTHARYSPVVQKLAALIDELGSAPALPDRV